ncbi:flagellar biosynthetic protein FliR [Roseovarius sp. SCSIO 43702]|uniref:flagellar biosynthetic protein FliR n=1 Tax=Roseovarius sp. SCSIO 43702 TaxID=2823043 RepID=UPI001C72AAF8|nr:flagellar biosynthetic protein FliR [Roseovarius sp. SCSIO 43702]QYX57089.1 flagellar biosynthetic protein FliR [Roseovarius sp. SCSIO 43702]
MSNAGPFLALAYDLVWAHFLVFLRAAPVMSLFPGFGETTVPVRIKLALAIAMTLIVTPAVRSQIGPLPDFAAMVPLALVETAIGLLIGIGLRLFLLALQTAGSMAAQATSLSQILGTAGSTPMPAMGHVLVVAALALAMMLGLHVRVAEMFIRSYALFPLGALPDPGAMADWGVEQIGAAFSLAFRLAAPFLIVSVIYNLTLGIINRAMPQLMVVFVGAPAISAAGLIGLMLLAPVMLGVWIRALERFTANPFGG